MHRRKAQEPKHRGPNSSRCLRKPSIRESTCSYRRGMAADCIPVAAAVAPEHIRPVPDLQARPDTSCQAAEPQPGRAAPEFDSNTEFDRNKTVLAAAPVRERLPARDYRQLPQRNWDQPRHFEFWSNQSIEKKSLSAKSLPEEGGVPHYAYPSPST